MIENISINDMLGRTVITQESNSNSQVIDIAGLQSATYFVNINTANGT